MPEHAAQPRLAGELFRRGGVRAGGRSSKLDRAVVERPVRSHGIGELGIPLAEPVHVLGVTDDEVVEALALERAYEGLGIPIHLRSRGGDALHLDAFTAQDGRERPVVLGVAIADDMGGCQAMISDVHQEVACLLSDPLPMRGEGRRGDPGPFAGDVLDEVDVSVALARGGLNGPRGEIRGPQGVPMPLDEVVPGSFPRQRSRLEAALAQEVPDDGAGDGASEAELAQLAMDAGDAPLVLGGHADDDGRDALGCSGATWASGWLRSARGGPVTPAGDGPWSGDGGDQLEPALGHRCRYLGQLAPLARCNRQDNPVPPDRLPGESATDYFNRINNNNTCLCCFRATQIAFGTGLAPGDTAASRNRSLWIPGDWGYIKNTNWRQGTWSRGLEGENIIRVFRGFFWGHPVGVKPLAEWLNVISGWTSNDGTTTGSPRVLVEVKYPSTGLEVP
jgi:hypothetical protein